MGLLAHGDVPRTLLEYHGLLLPTETENFGHAIVEAMQSGVVPIISDQTPWRHLREHCAGWDIDLRQPDLFREAVQQLHAMDASAYGDISAKTIFYIQEKLKIDQLATEYLRIFMQEDTSPGKLS
jgi:glycosyltransferase involved in cell wall biosynthesis